MQNKTYLYRILLFALPLAVLFACDEDESDPEEDHEHGAIIALKMTLQDANDASAAPIVVEFEDEDGPGGEAPVADSLLLEAGKDYTYSLAVLAEGEHDHDHDDGDGHDHEEEDVTEEIEEEAANHRFFFTGTLVSDNTVSATLDDDLGLQGMLTVATGSEGGSGTLVVTLKHYDDPADKPSDDDLAAGETDIEATYSTSISQ